MLTKTSEKYQHRVPNITLCAILLKRRYLCCINIVHTKLIHTVENIFQSAQKVYQRPTAPTHKYIDQTLTTYIGISVLSIYHMYDKYPVPSTFSI